MSDERLAELRASAEQWEVLTIRESRELLAEVEALRAEASLGAALRAVLREKRQFFGLVGPLAIGRDGAVCILHPDGTCSETDATRALQSLLSALPVVEDAADHREEERTARAESGADQESAPLRVARSTARTETQGGESDAR